MTRFGWARLAATLCLVPFGLWITALRATGPASGPLPSRLPAIVREPPPGDGTFPSATSAPDPGDEARALHARGITGRGIGLAVIDRPLLTTHDEFRDRLRWYDEIDVEPGDRAGWHSTAVVSIAAGRTAGAAPGADLYVVGVGMNWSREPFGNLFVAARRAVHRDQTVPLAIRRVLAVNRTLPASRKIRVLSLSIGGGTAFFAAVDEARREGVFVSAIDLGLPRMGPLTFASPAGHDAYTTHPTPAGSWAIARMAGLYALACAQDPQMTPERFMQARHLHIAR